MLYPPLSSNLSTHLQKRSVRPTLVAPCPNCVVPWSVVPTSFQINSIPSALNGRSVLRISLDLGSLLPIISFLSLLMSGPFWEFPSGQYFPCLMGTQKWTIVLVGFKFPPLLPSFHEVFSVARPSSPRLSRVVEGVLFKEPRELNVLQFVFSSPIPP